MLQVRSRRCLRPALRCCSANLLLATFPPAHPKFCWLTAPSPPPQEAAPGAKSLDQQQFEAFFLRVIKAAAANGGSAFAHK